MSKIVLVIPEELKVMVPALREATDTAKAQVDRDSRRSCATSPSRRPQPWAAAFITEKRLGRHRSRPA